jgi:hypothetical protein
MWQFRSMTTEPQPPPKQSKARSPAYPAYSLSTAIDLARKLWNAQRKQDTHIDSALKTLGYSARSGTAVRAIAGLRHYGLIDESGAKDDRKIRLSELAQDIIHLGENDERRKKALKTAALSPTIYAALWERYGAQLPDDAAIRPFLIRDKGYNDAVVDDLLADYRATLEFARLDKIDENVSNGEHSDKGREGATKAFGGGSQMGRKDMTLDQELPILVGDNRVARIPFPMTEDNFDLLIGTLNLWKRKLLAPKPKPDAESKASGTLEAD